MSRTAAWLLVLLWVPGALADDGGEEGLEDLSEGLGVLAAAALGLTIATAAWNWSRRRILLKALRGRGTAIKRVMSWHRRLAVPVHALAGLGALGAGTVHGLWAEQGHWSLWSAMAMMGVMTLGGAILLWKWPPAKVRKGVYVLHGQQGLLAAMLVLLLVGHGIVD